VGKQEIKSPEIICSLDFSFGSFLYIKAKKGTCSSAALIFTHFGHEFAPNPSAGL
jgi:hypothetical protein